MTATEAGEPTRPLAGVRVIDFTHHAAGPMCTMILGDYGADVIKVEPPSGEAFRTSGTVRVGGEHVGFLALNRNKKSVVLDLKAADGKAAVMDLIASAQVIVENFRPGTMERLGLGYDEVLKRNPTIVYCSLSAFGARGPYRDKQGLDVVLQAMSGLMTITGEPDGGPLPAGAPIADISSGVFGALGVTLAVLEQRNTGRPQRVELAMLDCMVSILNLRYQQMFAEERNPPRLGSGHPQACPWDVFSASDAPFVIAATRDEYWQRMCVALDIPQHARDPRFDTISHRVANREQLSALLNDLFRTRTREHWMRILDEAHVPNGPVNSLPDVARSEQAVHNGTFVNVRHPTNGEFQTVGSPIRINGESIARNGVPALGAHTTEVLAALRSATMARSEAAR